MSDDNKKGKKKLSESKAAIEKLKSMTPIVGSVESMHKVSSALADTKTGKSWSGIDELKGIKAKTAIDVFSRKSSVTCFDDKVGTASSLFRNKTYRLIDEVDEMLTPTRRSGVRDVLDTLAFGDSLLEPIDKLKDVLSPALSDEVKGILGSTFAFEDSLPAFDLAKNVFRPALSSGVLGWEGVLQREIREIENHPFNRLIRDHVAFHEMLLEDESARLRENASITMSLGDLAIMLTPPVFDERIRESFIKGIIEALDSWGMCPVVGQNYFEYSDDQKPKTVIHIDELERCVRNGLVLGGAEFLVSVWREYLNENLKKRQNLAVLKGLREEKIETDDQKSEGYVTDSKIEGYIVNDGKGEVYDLLTSAHREFIKHSEFNGVHTRKTLWFNLAELLPQYKIKYDDDDKKIAFIGGAYLTYDNYRTHYKKIFEQT